jgi:hypothetical protein
MLERVVEGCIAAGLVGGEGFAVDASLIAADANKQRSIAGQDWRKDRDPAKSSRRSRKIWRLSTIRPGAPLATLSRSLSRHPIRQRNGPGLTKGRHSSRTPTTISST